MTKKYNTIVFIGRFQPVHNAHVEIIRRAKDLADNLVIIIGSADLPRTYKNPFTYLERKRLIQVATADLGDPECIVTFDPLRDSMYNDQAWNIGVQEIVKNHTISENIATIGHKKDEETSDYLINAFPQWAFEEVELIEPLHATNIRDMYFREDYNPNFVRNVVPQTTLNFLDVFRKTKEWKQIIREREHIAEYKKQFSSLPYAPVFVTTDAVVIQSGHVLMVKRRSEPGKGLWALPGGFLDAEHDKSVRDCAIRELKEETGIKVPVPVLVGSIVDNRVFDAINRSARGRTITHAFKIILPDGELPKVKGQDDAEKANWIPLANLNPEYVFEDHFEIIQHFVGA